MKRLLVISFLTLCIFPFCMGITPFKICAKNMADIPIKFELRCDSISLVSDSEGILEITEERIRLYGRLKFQAVILNIHAQQIYMRHLFNDASTTSPYIHKDAVTFEELFSDADKNFYFKPKDKKFKE